MKHSSKAATELKKKKKKAAVTAAAWSKVWWCALIATMSYKGDPVYHIHV